MRYRYDLAISFAGEQRDLAGRIARRLDASGYAVFFDEFQQSDLWGKDLSVVLHDVYSKQARFCLILCSADYLQKSWTAHERRSAISAMMKRGDNYILCLKLDDAELPGFPTVIGHLTLSNMGEDGLHASLLQKLGPPDHEDQLSGLSSEDEGRARQVLEACCRRAVYTRMDSEISLSAMRSSIARAIGEVQAIAPSIENPALQHACNEIVKALDKIERDAVRGRERFSYGLSEKVRSAIDLNKQRVVHLLLEIRRAAHLTIQLPFALQTDHFMGDAEADGRPYVDRFGTDG